MVPRHHAERDAEVAERSSGLRGKRGTPQYADEDLQGFLPHGTWNKILIRGRAITVDVRAGLHLKYETCESGTLVQGQGSPIPLS